MNIQKDSMEHKNTDKEKVICIDKKKKMASDLITVIIMTAVILPTFSFFHHVLPGFTSANKEVTPVISYSAQQTDQESNSTANSGTQDTSSDKSTASENRTEWQIKFADKFTEDVVITENSYSSPNVSVTIDKHVETINGNLQTYYVADIYIAQVENLRTYFANDHFIFSSKEDVNSISRNSGAIVAMNGDYCTNQPSGLLVRNGDVYYTDQTTCDICALFLDGTVETYGPDDYDAAELLQRGLFQTWKFGPQLLDKNGDVVTEFNMTYILEKKEAPRSGFGYYEPGHYCFVVNDGRQESSKGMLLSEFAQLFKDLGCTRAYNMDGGASSVLTFQTETFSSQSSYRQISDILLITEIS